LEEARYGAESPTRWRKKVSRRAGRARSRDGGQVGGEINATARKAIGVTGDLADWPSIEHAIGAAQAVGADRYPD